MINFMNIKTGERKNLSEPHHIAAYLNSSDLGVNSNKGQDFGWRLAPEIIVRVDEMANDAMLLQNLATNLGIPIDELTTTHLVQHISFMEDQANRMSQSRREREPEFKNQYDMEIAKLRKGEDWDDAPAEVVAEQKEAAQEALAPAGEPGIDLAKIAEARAQSEAKPEQLDIEKEVAKVEAKPKTTPKPKTTE